MEVLDDRRLFSMYLEVLMPEYTSVYAQNGDQRLTQQPDDYVNSLGTLEEFGTVAYAQQSLGHHYSTVHPALSSDPAARRIRRVHVVLPVSINFY